MDKRFYRFAVFIIALGTVAIAVAYLLTQPTSVPFEPISPDTPTPSPLPTFTPRPTATPIIPPSQNQIPGDKHFFYGDWEQAIQSYQDTINTTENSEIRSKALLGLGKTYYEQNNYQRSLESLRNLITTYPDSSYIAEAQFALAETYSALERRIEAAEAYAAYLDHQPGVIDAYIQEKRGDALQAAGQHVAAVEAYRAAIASSGLDSAAGLKLKIGQSYQSLEDHQSARVIFQEVYDQTNNDYTKARADYLLGQTYDALKMPQEAQEAYLDAVSQFPLSYDSYRALVKLVERGSPVDELDRGLVDYFAGQYSRAIEAFDRYLADPESRDRGTALYYKGFSLYKTGNYQAALTPWEAIIDNYPEHDYMDEAWEFTAYTQWFYLGQHPQAVQTLLEFVEDNPYHNRAPEFLFDAARVSEYDGNLEQAANLWNRVFADYPTSSYANQSLFRKGLAHVRQTSHTKALASFQRLQQTAKNAEEESQAHLWIGKTHRLAGDEDAARAAWQMAVNADPTGYYSERARELLQDREPFQPPQDYDFGYDIEEEKRKAENWMRETFSIPPETNLSSLGPLSEDPRLKRGTELWNLGQYEAARAEFEHLRKEVDFDPVSSYRLANYLRELGLYRSAIYAARQVLNNAGMSDAETLDAPAYFNHIRFGNYYSELVLDASQNYDFHPLFLLSVMRQESLFEGFVRSSAGARGLMQIIPSTGADIANNASWPAEFSPDDLYRPKVSINFGAAYLNSQRNYFDGNLYAALAAYNGGPGNAALWLEASGGDYDLFLESIRFRESREYIKGIAEIFSIYRRLYQRSP